jgi:chromosome partitioning protein
MVLNAKGGCGKSTLATNIASYFANEGASVALADYDPQRSSLDWLDRRPENRPTIASVAAFEDGLRHVHMQATTTFLKELQSVGKVQKKQAKLGVLANRVRDNTLIWGDLDEYLTRARVPYVAALREAQNYVRAYTRGLGIFELPEYLGWPDWDEWEPLTAWLRSKRSQP